MSKNYLITGACRGIGRGLSRILLQKGHRVFLLDNNEVELEHMRTQLPKWLPELSSSPSSASPAGKSARYELFHGDLGRTEDIELAADSAGVFFDGHLDVLINNAGVTDGVQGAHVTSSEFLDVWNRSLAVNLTGAMMLSRACVPLLKARSSTGLSSSSSLLSDSSAIHLSDTSARQEQHEQQQQQRRHGGSIIFISSTRAYQSEPNSEAYATTKAGLLGLSQSLACSLGTPDTNIKVNAILPGWIDVAHESQQGDAQHRAQGGDDLTRQDHEWHFAGRVGKVEDVARAVEYLTDNPDTFVTGTEIVLDGGVTRRMVYPE